MEAMKINLVSFDADGTIVKDSYVDKFWFQELPRLYARKKGIEFSEARETVTSKYNEIGDEDIRWYQPEYWFDRFELEEDPGEVIERIQVPENVELYRDAVELIEDIYGAYGLVVTSNAPRVFLEYALRSIEDRFRKVYSCVTDFGEVKKHPGVYQKVAERVGVNAGEMVHVGDHWRFDYQVPRELGITSFYIDRDTGAEERAENVLTDLRQLREFLPG